MIPGLDDSGVEPQSDFSLEQGEKSELLAEEMVYCVAVRACDGSNLYGTTGGGSFGRCIVVAAWKV